MDLDRKDQRLRNSIAVSYTHLDVYKRQVSGTLEFLGGALMREINMDLFYEEMMKVVDVLEGKEMDNIRKASEVCADTIAQGGVVHVLSLIHI